jgi:farnesyl-diphosphate farnesyltransferase
MAEEAPDVLRDLLAAVSRSFYLTVRVLPAKIRRPIGLAYLLARATDTIADTSVVPADQRLLALDQLRRRILGEDLVLAGLDELAEGQSLAEERALLVRVEEAIGLLGGLSHADQRRIRAVLEVITGGQELDLQRFGSASAKSLVALQSEGELDDYTYRVAGCVGEFWTHTCREVLFPKATIDDALLLERAIRFGKGLQLVNILRDLPKDLAMGRCYLPKESLEGAGLSPEALRDAATMPRFLPLYGRYLDRAEANLAAGWSYTNMLPRRQVRVRLACAWPILIGLRTVSRLRLANVLNPAKRVKIDRREVKLLMLRSVLCYPRESAWQRLFEHARR